MMVFRRSLHPVNSLKHIVDIQGGLIADTQVVEDVIKVVENPVTTVAKDVENGCTVSAIFLNVQVSGTGTGALSNVYMYVMKNPGNNIVNPQANLVGVSDERRFIIHQEMIMTEKNTTAIPRTLFKGVIKIPRGYKRFGVKDRLQVALFSPGVTYEYCLQCIYKEIR